MRAVITGLFFLLAAAGVLFVLRYNERTLLVASPAAAIEVGATDPGPPPSRFDEYGTLSYYPNNTGYQVPFLVFKAKSLFGTSGVTETRALDFDSGSTCITAEGTFRCTLIEESFSHYYGGSYVHVTGQRQAEGVIVDTVLPA